MVEQFSGNIADIAATSAGVFYGFYSSTGPIESSIGFRPRR
jgi:hypothetical protein